MTDNGRTTIPKELREKYGIEPRDTVIREDTESGVVIQRVISDAGRGMLVDENLDREDREAIAKALADEARRRRETGWTVE